MVNRLEKIRAEVSKTGSRVGRPEESQPARPRPERRLLRRNSSVNRAKRPPDTFHPSLVRRSREEMVTNIETSVRDLVRKSELLKAEIKNVEKIKQEEVSSKTSESQIIKQEPLDTSDSGIVTDDSEVALGSRKKFYTKNHYEEPWKLSEDMQKRIPDKQDSIAQELNKIETINSEIQKNEEQIVALSFEFDTLSESKHNISSEVVILNNFVSEVKRLRSENSGHLQEITNNRDAIVKFNNDKERRNKMVKQLEFDTNMLEREGTKLRRSLDQLRLVELPQPPDLQYQYSNPSVCDNVTSGSHVNHIPVLPVRNKVTNEYPVKTNPDSNQLPDLTYLLSPSTLV